MLSDFNKSESMSEIVENTLLQQRCAHALRMLSVESVEKAKSGHPGLPMGMADVATVLFQEFLTYAPQDPLWGNRDRFVLSAGHGSALLYSLLYVCGYPSVTLEELKKFRCVGSLTPGHPEHGLTPGVEATTGPLGQGMAMAVGMAIAQKMKQQRLLEMGLSPKLCDHKIYVLVSDGDLMEGISQEAISLAGHLQLSNLVVIFDDNGITIDGKTDLAISDDITNRFKACQFDVLDVEGHNFESIRSAFEQTKKQTKPVILRCKTVIGFGAPTKAGTSSCHGSPLGQTELNEVRKAFDWSEKPFEVPDDILAFWKRCANRSQEAYQQWQSQINNCSREAKDILQAKSLTLDVPTLLKDLKQSIVDSQPIKATRIASQDVLDVLTKASAWVVGGSADLTPSNNTKGKGQQAIQAQQFAGSYIHFGIREHAMAAMLNGLSLYGGFIPYGGTFLVFSDYLRPALRLSALMKQRVVYVFTHDSIGLGEDGPTHQPVEHLSALRAIPNVYVFRPCDALETLECWKMALSLTNSPSVLALSRQNLPTLSHKADELLVDKGGYVLYQPETGNSAVATLVATGSEVSLAMETKDILMEQGIHVRVVSMPCVDLFKEQAKIYKDFVLADLPIVVIEAGVEQSFEFITALPGNQFIGMSSFGESGPAQDVYQHFNIHVGRICEEVKRLISENKKN